MLYYKYSSFFPHTFSNIIFCGGEKVNLVICVWFYILTQTHSHTICIKLKSELNNISPNEGTPERCQSQGRFSCLVSRAGLEVDSWSDQEHLSDGE